MYVLKTKHATIEIKSQPKQIENKKNTIMTNQNTEMTK